MFFLFNNFGKTESTASENSKSKIKKDQQVETKTENINYNSYSKNKYPKRTLSYVQKGDMFLIHNPCNDELIPLEFIDFEIQYRVSFSGKIIFTGNPPCQIQEEPDGARAPEGSSEYAQY
jgi:hypothetical protein